jgi:AraC family transcriptional regulator of adaptative response/methylated-DNA-[protein]-cysteine methyltransferase
MEIRSSRDCQNKLDIKVNYIFTPSPLGRLLVAATENGVCAVSIGDDDGILLSDLQHKYPNLQIKLDSENLLDIWVNPILAYLNGEILSIDINLDIIKATTFQWRVWEAICHIPYGKTSSYQEIAEIIGNSKAVRAVANACGKNPVALVIPCHRVIRSNGDLGGYYWGLERKQHLLKLELDQSL